MSIGLACRAFWKALTDQPSARSIAIALDGQADASDSPLNPRQLDGPVTDESFAGEVESPAYVKNQQNPAVALIAAMQREARLLDLVFEDLDSYGDDQVGSAARPVLKSTRTVLQRILGVERLIDSNENASVEIPAAASPTRYQAVDGATATGTRTVVHPGWRAAKTELPTYTGPAEDAEVLSPVQFK